MGCRCVGCWAWQKIVVPVGRFPLPVPVPCCHPHVSHWLGAGAGRRNLSTSVPSWLGGVGSHRAAPLQLQLQPVGKKMVGEGEGSGTGRRSLQCHRYCALLSPVPHAAVPHSPWQDCGSFMPISSGTAAAMWGAGAFSSFQCLFPAYDVTFLLPVSLTCSGAAVTPPWSEGPYSVSHFRKSWIHHEWKWLWFYIISIFNSLLTFRYNVNLMCNVSRLWYEMLPGRENWLPSANP